MNLKYTLKLTCLLLMSAPLAAFGQGTKIKGFCQPEALKQPAISSADMPGEISDRTFLRRVFLDLAGRVPTPNENRAFLNSNAANKRAAVIDNLLQSAAFTERLSTFLQDMLGLFPLEPGAPYRNSQHRLVRNAVARNDSWDSIATALLTDAGPGTRSESSFSFWSRKLLLEEYRLDAIDDQMALITDTFLGVQSLCISCHDGQYHLEEVNVGLTAMKREQFWGMAAFLASTYVGFPLDEDVEEDKEFESLHFVDRDGPSYHPDNIYLVVEGPFKDGEYHATSNGEGMRPPRNGGVIQPAYFTTGAGLLPGETRRQALARHITTDRQFARNMVNRVWAWLMGEGFVEPINSWDLARVDESVAAQNQTTVQPRNPATMAYLTDQFIQSGYDLRALIRLIANSSLYQWNYSAIAEANQDDIWGYWRGKNRIKRMEAEALVDSIQTLLGLPQRYMIAGDLETVYNSTWQLPDTTEPNETAIFDLSNVDAEDPPLLVDPTTLGFRSLEDYFIRQYSTHDMLAAFGRGDAFFDRPRNRESNIPNALYLLNNEALNYWLAEVGSSPYLTEKIEALKEGQSNPAQVIETMFLDFLGRPPTQDERTRMQNHFQAYEFPDRPVADTAWVLINHPEFMYY